MNILSEKCFRDTRTQLGILKGRGLVIKNKKFAKKTIRETNYYNLINGYKEPFILTSTPSEVYKPGTRFEELVALYEFDRKLRLITLEEILKIEKHTKTIIAYCFSKKHGHRDYLKFENFDTTGSVKFMQVSKLLSEMYYKIKQNEKDASLLHYVKGKNYLPLWVLVNAISLGDISKFYSNMLPAERDEVAKRIKWGVRQNQLANWLQFLSSVRNRCAHDERLYCYHSYVQLQNNQYFSYFRRTTSGYFAVIVAFKTLLSAKDFADYQSKIESLFADLSSKLHTINVKHIQQAMDMPYSWKKISSLK